MALKIGTLNTYAHLNRMVIHFGNSRGLHWGKTSMDKGGMSTVKTVVLARCSEHRRSNCSAEKNGLCFFSSVCFVCYQATSETQSRFYRACAEAPEPLVSVWLLRNTSSFQGSSLLSGWQISSCLPGCEGWRSFREHLPAP